MAVAWEVIKWILIVFAAGFVGYFGKYLSKLVIAKVHKKEQTVIKTESPYDAKYKYKLEKKKLKAQKKAK